MDISIAIDVMGGDHGPSVTLPAAGRALVAHPGLSLHLVGDEAEIGDPARHAIDMSRCRVVHAPQTVAMDDKPSIALRNRRESSICGAMPGIAGATHMLDLGANVDSSSEELFRFAVMGSVLASAIENKPAPTVALLNIGEEEIKGNDRVKQTAALLEASDLNYFGFVEGDDIFKGKVDVVVCDGFVGNVALKSSEGVARMLMQFARDEFTRSLFRKLSALLAKPALAAMRNRADPGRYNGASLLGLKGIVIKSHGSADTASFANAIDVAVMEIRNKVPERISNQIERMLVDA